MFFSSGVLAAVHRHVHCFHPRHVAIDEENVAAVGFVSPRVVVPWGWSRGISTAGSVTNQRCVGLCIFPEAKGTVGIAEIAHSKLWSAEFDSDVARAHPGLEGCLILIGKK